MPRPAPNTSTGERRYCCESSPKQIHSMASKLMYPTSSARLEMTEPSDPANGEEEHDHRHERHERAEQAVPSAGGLQRQQRDQDEHKRAARRQDRQRLLGARGGGQDGLDGGLAQGAKGDAQDGDGQAELHEELAAVDGQRLEDGALLALGEGLRGLLEQQRHLKQRQQGGDDAACGVEGRGAGPRRRPRRPRRWRPPC